MFIDENLTIVLFISDFVLPTRTLPFPVSLNENYFVVRSLGDICRKEFKPTISEFGKMIVVRPQIAFLVFSITTWSLILI